MQIIDNKSTTANSVYPYGMGIKSRAFVSFDDFRYGFGSQEKDDEISGKGNSYTAEFWQYDSRLGRRWNLDPKPTFGISGYVVFADNPILFRDVAGDTLSINIFSKFADLVNVAYNKVATTFIKVQKPDGIFAVFDHATPRKLFGNAKAPGDADTPEKLKDLLVAQDNKELNDAIKNKTPITIILYACNSGVGPNSIAQQFSKEYDFITIVAPDGDVAYGPIKKPTDQPTIVGVTNPTGDGGWRTFKGGAEIKPKRIDNDKLLNKVSEDSVPRPESQYSVTLEED